MIADSTNTHVVIFYVYLSILFFELLESSNKYAVYCFVAV